MPLSTRIGLALLPAVLLLFGTPLTVLALHMSFAMVDPTVLVDIITVVNMLTAFAAVAVSNLIYFESRKQPTFNRQQWWHLYFGSVVALCGSILAHTVVVVSRSQQMNTVAWLFLAAAFCTAFMARFSDSGMSSDWRSLAGYSALFAAINGSFIGVTQLALSL